MSGSVLAMEYLNYGQYQANNGFYMPKTNCCAPVDMAAVMGLGEIASYAGIKEDKKEMTAQEAPQYEMQNGRLVAVGLYAMQETCAHQLVKACVKCDVTKMVAILEGYDPVASALLCKMQADPAKGEWDYELDNAMDVSDMQKQILSMKMAVTVPMTGKLERMTACEAAKVGGEAAVKCLVSKYADKCAEIGTIGATMKMPSSLPKNASFSGDIAPPRILGQTGSNQYTAFDAPDYEVEGIMDGDDIPESIEELWKLVDRQLLKACQENDIVMVKRILDGNTGETMELMQKLDSDPMLGDWDRSIDFEANLPLVQHKLLNDKLNPQEVTTGPAAQTPLMVACSNGNLALMNLLINEYGADPTFQHPTTKNTALFSTFTKNSKENKAAAELLLKQLEKTGQLRTLKMQNAQNQAAIDLAKSLKWDPLANMIQGFMVRTSTK